VDFEKGQTFDFNDLDLYGKGDLSRKIVVDFKGIALQIEGKPSSKHPTMNTLETTTQTPEGWVLLPSPSNALKEHSEQLVPALLNLNKGFSFSSHKRSQYFDPISPHDLGDQAFMDLYQVDYPLYTGAMAKGIASADLVIACGKRKMLASLGAGGLPLQTVEENIKKIQAALPNGPFAVNLIHSPADDILEKGNVDLFLKYGVRVVEASAFMSLTPHVVRYRLAGLRKGANGQVICDNKIIFKVSRTELAELALRPAPKKIVDKLVREGLVTQEQARFSQFVPMCDDIAVEADSGGHTDNRPLHVILPLIIATRNRIQAKLNFPTRVRVGAGGGIGCPEAALAAFQMGAAFVVTGSVNQMARQAGTCDNVRAALAKAKYSDVTMAPAADMFDIGVELQVLKTKTMFPARAKKLFDLFCRYNSLEELPPRELAKLEKSTFKKSVAEVWAETVNFYRNRLGDHDKIDNAERDPKLKMSLVFRWYLSKSSGWANRGESDRVMDYQIWCGPAIGSFNEFIKGSYLDPTTSGAYPCVFQINSQLLHGACYLTRLSLLSACFNKCSFYQHQGAYRPNSPL